MYESVKDLGLDGRVTFDQPMREWTTMKVGGPADCAVCAASARDVERVARFCAETNAPLTIVGKGSNLVVRDGGIRGVVLRLGEDFARITAEGCTLRAQAGAALGAVCRAAQRAGLTGLEFAEGIPGSVGGGVYMNAGAYGGEMSQALQRVRALMPDGRVQTLSLEQMRMGYRHTALMDLKAVCLEAEFALSPDDPDAIAARMADYNARRREKQPLQFPSCGSFFKRPQGHFAGKLIEDAGLKGAREGGAMISPLHAGFLINVGGATARDILTLMERVQREVWTRFHVRLEPEARIIGCD